MANILGEYIVHLKPSKWGRTTCAVCGEACSAPMNKYETQLNTYYIPMPLCEPCSDENPDMIDDLHSRLQAHCHVLDQKGAAK